MAQLIPEVRRIDEDLFALAGGSVTGLGTVHDGMKLQAASACHAGADVVIAAAASPTSLRLAAGESRAPASLPPKAGARAGRHGYWPELVWMLLLDKGAVDAIVKKGRSLLPAGITGVEGDFMRGDTILVADAKRHELARGLVAYSSQDLRQLIGCKSGEIEGRLGYTYGDEAIHRNNLVSNT